MGTRAQDSDMRVQDMGAKEGQRCKIWTQKHKGRDMDARAQRV